MSNNLRTVLLLGVMTALVVGIAWLFGVPLWGGLITAAVINFSAYWFSDKMALKGARAKPVTERQMPEVYRIVRELTVENGMPMPSIHRIKSGQANAFATGRNPRHAAVAVTDGIMDLLDERELRGVLGHELSHVKNRDILISSIAAVLGAALSFFVSRSVWSSKESSAWIIPASIFTPFASAILRSGISKTREFEADHDGGELTTDPLALASALERIEDGARKFPLRLNAALGGLFISDPLLGFSPMRGLRSMLSTHPPTNERVARLAELAEAKGWTASEREDASKDKGLAGALAGKPQDDRDEDEEKPGGLAGGMFAKPHDDGEGGDGGGAEVSGTVTYRERIAMPPNAVVTVTLSDTSRMDAPAEEMGRQVIDEPGNVPVPYSIPFDPASIVDNHSYSVRATIEVQDQLAWTTDTNYPVITRDSGLTADLVLVRVPRRR